MSAPQLLKQFYQAVESVETSTKEGKKVYIQIQGQTVGVTTNSKEKAPFEKIANLMNELQNSVQEREEDLKLYLDTLERFKNISETQKDSNLFSFLGFGGSKGEKIIEEIPVIKLKQMLQ